MAKKRPAQSAGGSAEDKVKEVADAESHPSHEEHDIEDAGTIILEGPSGRDAGAKVDEIEAGTISAPDDRGYAFKEQKVEDTAATIALILVWILAGTIIIHYLATTIAIAQGVDEEKLQAIERIFNTLLPVISGMVGSAVAYYFGRQRSLRSDRT